MTGVADEVTHALQVSRQVNIGFARGKTPPAAYCLPHLVTVPMILNNSLDGRLQDIDLSLGATGGHQYIVYPLSLPIVTRISRSIFLALSDLTLLALSLVALALGPVVYGAARVAGHMMAALDGFVFVAITGLVVLHIVPESVALAGWLAVAGVAVGIWLPTLIEHRLRSLARQVHNVTLIFGLMAIAVHAFTDGLVLGTDAGDHGQAHMLPMAVVVHRLPVGLTVWFLLRPLYGLRAATVALALMALATTAGFYSGDTVLATLESRVWGLFQALVAGSLLHVVLHRSYPVTAGSVSPSTRAWQSGLGAIAGLLLLGATTAGHDLGTSINAAASVFYVLARESAPALLLAYVAAGVVYGLMPRGTVEWMKRGSNLSQAVRGMGFGLPLPICSCGVVPIYRSLVVAGVPATAAMAFLVATPELSLDAVLISLPLLGGEFTVVRVAAAAIVALFTGWIVGPLARTLVAQRSSSGASQTSLPLLQRLRQGLAQGLGEVVDTTAPWILLGLVLAAGAHALVGGRWDLVVPAAFEVEFFALLGMPIYVCASGATPLVAVLIHNGVSPGAALAFLLTGPATNMTTLGVLTRLHGRRTALMFSAAVVVVALLLGRVVNGLTDVTGQVPDLTEHAEHGSWWQDAALLLLTGLFLLSLVRQGPRAFVGEIFEADGDGESEHDHDHDHEFDECGDHCDEDSCSTSTPGHC
jgi:uncharacterized protein